ncbi:hypothetical protein [Polaromonas sp. YR568]
MRDSSFFAEDDEPMRTGRARVADMLVALALTAAAAILVLVASRLW